MTSQLVTRSNFARLGIANEAIAFQNDSFGSQLEAIFYDIQKYIETDDDQSHLNSKKREEPYSGWSPNTGKTAYRRIKLARSDFGDLLADLIYRRLGIKINFQFNNDCFGAVMPMYFNENHVFLDKVWHGGDALPSDQIKLIKEAKNKTGWVDVAHAKVGGIFSEYNHNLWLDVVGHLQLHGTTVPEVVAILLHELGHAFTTYEFANRLEDTNLVLANLSDELRNNKDPKKRTYILLELAGKMGLKDKDMDDIIEEKNEVIFGVRLFKKYVDFVRSQLPNNKYTETSSEQIADNFASRFGYGRQLITALDKMYKSSPERSASMRTLSTFAELFNHLYRIGGAIILGKMGQWVMLIVGALFYGFILYMSGDDTQDMTYDVLKIRYKRIRQQYIEMINSLPLSKDELRGVIDNVHHVDEIIKNTEIYRSLLNRLSNFLFKRHRDAKDSIELQYLLEEITHNNLFLKSAELKLLA